MSELSLKEQMQENERLFEETGSLFGLNSMPRKEGDPGTYEAVWHILSNLCNAAWDIGCKVSSSPIAAEGGDALWGLHTPTGEAICISRGISAHAGLLSDMIKNFIRMDYQDNPGFKEGDIFENNDPHYGGIHSPDFDMCMPLFHDGKLIAWASCVSHVADAGSVTPGSIGYINPDCYSDGICIAMEKVGESDAFYPWYEKRIRSRSRAPDFVMGDARGRLAGCLAIRERLAEVIEKYTIDFILDAGQEYVEDSRRYAVARIKSQTIPGRVRKSQFKDLAMKDQRVLLPKQQIDCMFSLPMDLEILPNGNVTLSLDGASGVVPFGENISPTALKSGLMMGYSHIIGFDMFNSGPISAWDIKEPPPGSWANPFPVHWDAACGVGWAPAVTWLSNLYEVFGRQFQMRGFVEEMAAGSATIMTAEFSGVNQMGMYLVGLTLEQASNGSPAKGYSDGENSAWCIYTPEADFGNGEITELYYPIMFLGRNTEPDSGGYGQFRGGLGHTAVWMVHGTTGLEYACGDAGSRSKIIGNHGMYGAYPVWPDRPSYARDTNLKQLIDEGKPLVHERGDAVTDNLAANVEARIMENGANAPFVSAEPLQDYDVIMHPIGGAQAMGDPLDRDPASIESDLNKGWGTLWVAENVHGAVVDKVGKDFVVDAAATDAKRQQLRQQRKQQAVPFKEWWAAERAKVAATENMDAAVVTMWNTSMELSPAYGAGIRSFWKLADDFTFKN
jgi:N-methylhydantoinase B/oxoprolinase/acetone carboxylase alpha subunit